LFKLKQVYKEPKVLIAVSGGISSMLLLHLMAEFSRVDLHFEKRRPRYPKLHVCHIDQSIIFKNSELANNIRSVVEDYQLPFSCISLESIFQSNISSISDNGYFLIT
jgi:tRNA(Ile)-lysidine synthase TilS/MesJ